MKSDGSNFKNLTNGQYDLNLNIGAWSPDSRHIVFSANSGRNPPLYKLYIANILTDEIIPVSLSNGLNPLSPSWSPDGQNIAFRGNYWIPQNDGGYLGSPGDIYLVHPDGSNLVQITNDSSFDKDSPQWSPDGKRIAFIFTNIGGLYIVNVDGTNNQHFTTPYCEKFNFVLWSPDNQHIAGYCINNGKGNLAIIDADDFSQSPIIITDGWDPSFSPDGNFIAYESGDGMVISDIYGKNPHLVTKLSGSGLAWSSPTIDNRTSITASETPVVTEYCGNPFWPIINGEKWTYQSKFGEQQSPPLRSSIPQEIYEMQHFPLWLPTTNILQGIIIAMTRVFI